MTGFSWPKPAASGRLSNDGLSITLRGGPRASRDARTAMEIIARDLTRPIVQRVQLLVTELVNNSVRHGEVGSDGEVALDVALRNGVVRITVTDSGPGFEPAEPVADPARGEGFGLLIVDRLARRWGVARGGRSVWFEMERGAGRALTPIVGGEHA